MSDGVDISVIISAFQAATASLTEARDEAQKRADRAGIAFDAERSRADRSEPRAERAEARADQAEKDLIAERHRADQAEVTLDRLETELDTEKIARAEAEADAVELRRAEVVRKGQGRWARLREAWRRE